MQNTKPDPQIANALRVLRKSQTELEALLGRLSLHPAAKLDSPNGPGREFHAALAAARNMTGDVIVRLEGMARSA